MEVSELRKELVKIHDNNVNQGVTSRTYHDIMNLDSMMMGVFGKMWDEERQDYT